jgi:hypothetical protein
MTKIASLFALVVSLFAGTAFAQPGPQPPPAPWTYASPLISAPSGNCVGLPTTVTGGCVAPNSMNVSGGYYVNGVPILPLGNQSPGTVFGVDQKTNSIAAAPSFLSIINWAPQIHQNGGGTSTGHNLVWADQNVSLTADTFSVVSGDQSLVYSLTIGGTPAAGNTVTVTFTLASIAYPVVYSVQLGDTTTSIATAMAACIAGGSTHCTGGAAYVAALLAFHGADGFGYRPGVGSTGAVIVMDFPWAASGNSITTSATGGGATITLGEGTTLDNGPIITTGRYVAGRVPVAGDQPFNFQMGCQSGANTGIDANCGLMPLYYLGTASPAHVYTALAFGGAANSNQGPIAWYVGPEGVYTADAAGDGNGCGGFSVDPYSSSDPGYGNLSVCGTAYAKVSIVSPNIYGGSATNSSLILATTNNGSPSGDVLYLDASVISIRPTLGGAGSAQLAIGTQNVSTGVLIIASPTANQMILENAASATGTATFPSGTYTISGDSLANVFTAAQTINLNAASPPTPQSGTLLQVTQVDATAARIELDAFGNFGRFSCTRADGTGASPTAVQNADQICAFNGFGYNGASYIGVGGVNFIASQNWSVGANGSQIQFSVIPNNSAAVITAMTINNNGSTDVFVPGIGSTSTDGIELVNATAAAAGAQQWSPRLHFQGQGWKTASTAASEVVDFIEEVQSVQGTAAPFANLTWSYQVGGLGYAVGMTLGSNSQLSVGTPGMQGFLTLYSSTANSMTLEGAASANGTATIPSGTYNFVGDSLAQSLSAKTISGNLLSSGSAPTCAVTGAGSSASCALSTGSNDFAGQITITAGGTGITDTGTITLTLNASLGADDAGCVMNPASGTGAWTAPVTFVNTTLSQTAPVWTWTNASTNLTTSNTYKVNYHCVGY